MITQADLDQAARVECRERLRAFLLCIPLWITSAFFFARRVQILCILCAILGCYTLLFWGGLRWFPARHYRKYLEEIRMGLTHDETGMLVRLGEEEVLENGVAFIEVILNLYADLSPEGERRFLIDKSRAMRPEILGKVIRIRAHGHWIVDYRLREEGVRDGQE